MRLLHTTRLVFKEFFDTQIPIYAVLSHRWGPTDQEVSHAEFKSEEKKSTSGYAKIRELCKLAHSRGFDYCWIDTCCIDKTSSAELTEAINSMYDWYRKAGVCYAYLSDVDSASKITESIWFTRGWCLQELIAPKAVEFFDRDWRPIGTRYELTTAISEVTGVGPNLLLGKSQLSDYSIARIMSWASRRTTSRLEDEAYCLLGLFGINMPLLYGEGANAFLRLQEEILKKGEDNSIFTWGLDSVNDADPAEQWSILAPSPRAFQGCGIVRKGFATQRILFEVTNRGMMILIHRTYDQATLDKLLEAAYTTLQTGQRMAAGLTIPLGCFTPVPQPGVPNAVVKERFYLQLGLHAGKWCRLGVTRAHDKFSSVEYRGTHYFAYTNDYVRLYLYHNGGDQPRDRPATAPRSPRKIARPEHWFHLRDTKVHKDSWAS